MKRLLLLLAISQPAFADDWYVAYGAGQVQIPFSVKVPPKWQHFGFYTVVDDESQTVSGTLGYRLGDKLSVEASYNDLGDYSACARNVFLDRNLFCAFATVRSFSIGLTGHVYGPIYLGLQIHHATARGALVTDLAEYDGWVPSASIGARTPLGEHSRLRLQLNSYPIQGYFLGIEQDLR